MEKLWKKIHFYLLIITLFLCLSSENFAQKSSSSKSKVVEIVAKTDNETKKNASLNYKAENYATALGYYLSLQKGTPENTEYNYRIGVCYMNMNVVKLKAIPFFEMVVKQKDSPKDALFYLARANHMSDKFEEAITNYEKYKESFPSGKGLDKEDLDEVNRNIQMCKNGKESKSNTIDVTFENLGPLINSPYPDYNPFITSDESMLVFSSRRPTTGTLDEFGSYNADVFYSTMKEFKWVKAKSIGMTINTKNDDEAIHLSVDGKKLLLFQNELETGMAEITMATLKGKVWSKPVLLGDNINSEELESGATISPDGNTIYFSSERKLKDKGMGGRDLFKSNLLPDGTWGPASNLGSVINSPYDEDAPYIHSDGKTLYFSSKGHSSMGGFDIFKSEFDENSNSWSSPENLGYPINTGEDNLYFSLSIQGKYAYVSAIRPEGLGDFDVYKVTFNVIQRNNYMTIIKGKIFTTDSVLNAEAKITFMNKSDPENFGQYKSNPENGKYIITSNPGTYLLLVDAPGYVTYSEEIIIPEIMQPTLVEKDIRLIFKPSIKSEPDKKSK